MGLHDSQDSLGGEMAWGMGLSVFTPLWPGKEAWPARLHGFLNAGKISGYNRGEYGDHQHTIAHEGRVRVVGGSRDQVGMDNEETD